MTTVESLRRNQTAFDYIIVGGGTASILLIEGGESDIGKENLHDLKLQPKGNSFIQHSRGKVLGGYSNINGCISFRPLEYDIRKWQEAGAHG
ncbi:hypothetical protein MRS44_013041 [Fusarium solani]|uniref:uncharacterized protein n=1 Tax=Fusarium solani TaxID=169388 RepID=UPI0032C4A0AC|nr:hypothetical protein MRS44_013041 [Fusarium solani]